MVPPIGWDIWKALLSLISLYTYCSSAESSINYAEYRKICQYPNGRFLRETPFCVITCHQESKAESREDTGGQVVPLVTQDQGQGAPPLAMICRGLVGQRVPQSSPIQHISSSEFSDLLPFLYSLELQESLLPEVNASLLGPMSQLRRLLLSGNEIKRVQRDALIGLEHLTCLDLSYNRIRQLDAYLFRRNPGLFRLNLTGNSQLSLLPNHPQRRLLDTPASNSLRHLHLDYMNLTKLPTEFLSRIQALTSLTLRGNRIRELLFNQLPFTMAKNRIHYDFRDNVIAYVEGTAFHRHHVPLILDLRNNRIGNLNFLFTPPLTPCHWERSTVNLHGNPIVCDCAVYNFTRVKTTSAIILGVCQQPVVYRNLLLYGWLPRRDGVIPEASETFFEQAAGDVCYRPRETEPRARLQFECRCNSWRRVDQEMDDYCMLQRRIDRETIPVGREIILCASPSRCLAVRLTEAHWLTAVVSWLLIGWKVVLGAW